MKYPSLTYSLASLGALLLMAQGAAADNLVLTNSYLGAGTDGSWDNGANFASQAGNAPGPADTVILTNLPNPTTPSLSGLLLAQDVSWTNYFDGVVPFTSQVNTTTINALWVNETNDYSTYPLNVANGEGIYSMKNGVHNVLINNQLNIVSTNPWDIYHIYSNTVAIGTGQDNTNSLVYTTLAGPGSLNVTNPVGCIWVMQGSLNTAGGAAETHAAVLDMSGLSTFNCVLSNIVTAADMFSTNYGGNLSLYGYQRPQGIIYFAATNYITLLDTNFPALVVGYEPDNNGGTYSISNCLGQLNYLNFDQMLIGGPKTAGAQSGLYFNGNTLGQTTAAAVNSILTTNNFAVFRNIDGVSPQTSWDIGDNTLSPLVTGSSYGNVNFQRGGVDASVQTIYLGRSGTPNDTGTSIGNLTVGNYRPDLQGSMQSVINAGQIEIGDMLDKSNACQGQLTVYSNAVVNVTNYIRLINLPSSTNNSIGSRGFLLVDGGTVNVSGNILDNGTANGGGYTILEVWYGGTLNMEPVPSVPPGNVSVATFYLGAGTFENFGTLNVSSNMYILAPNTQFALGSGQALQVGPLGYANLLKITNNGASGLVAQLNGFGYTTNLGNGAVGLSLSNSTVLMDIGANSDKINVSGSITLQGTNRVYVNPIAGFSAGTYPIMVYNTSTSALDASGTTNYGLIGDPATQLVASGPITNYSYSVSFNSSTPGIVNMVVTQLPDPTTPPILSSVVSSNNLTLSWPLAYNTYFLQAQTNSLSVGLSSNWTTVPTVYNSLTVPIIRTNASVFYRLEN